MAEYKKIDLSKLRYADEPLSMDDALKDIVPFENPEEIAKALSRPIEVGSQTRDFNWFIDSYEELYSKYGHRFLAIKNAEVIGDYSTYAEGVKRTLETEPIGTFIVQECDGSESAYLTNISSMNFAKVI